MSTHCAAEALKVNGLEVRFGSLRAVAGADLSVAPGEVLALLGPSGCGKTTLLRCIAGFERASAGEIRIGGERVEGRGAFVPPHRRPVGLVFQDYALFPHRTVADNIVYGLPRTGERRVRLAELLALGGLEGLGGRYPHQLSGGQQQRVAVLRSLAPRPRILLLDEPFSNLDPALRAGLRGDVARLLRAEGVTIVLVTHDRADALAVADRVAIMEAGRILQCDTPEALYFRPSSPAVARFAGAVQYVDGRADGATVGTAVGRLQSVGPVWEGPCRVLIRPEWLLPCAGGVPAQIEGAQFEGEQTRYGLRLAGGATLRMTASSGQVFAGGPLAVGVCVPVPTFPIEHDTRANQADAE